MNKFRSYMNRLLIINLFFLYTLNVGMNKDNSDIRGLRNGEKHPLQVKFLDVGQGDAIIIKFPNGKSMLIDGGPKESSEVVLNGLILLGVKKVDLIVSTHPDIDHIGGLLDVLRSVPVKKVYDSGKGYDTLTYLEYIRLIHEKQIPFSILNEGAQISLDKNMTIQVLNSGEGKAFNNNASIVLLLKYKDLEILFTGDAEKKVEKKLVKKYDIQADILKVAHHGSHSSTTKMFLEKVQPEYAIISYENKNPFHHPHNSVMKRLKKQGIKCFTTAQLGDIDLKSDGLRLWIEEEEYPILK